MEQNQIEEILTAIKQKWVKDFGSLEDHPHRDGFFVAGFVQSALNEMESKQEESKVMKWVKASERLPQENLYETIHIRLELNHKQCWVASYQKGKFCRNFIPMLNQRIEWLDESPKESTPGEKKFSVDQIRSALLFMWSAKEVEMVDSVKISDKDKFINDYIDSIT